MNNYININDWRAIILKEPDNEINRIIENIFSDIDEREKYIIWCLIFYGHINAKIINEFENLENIIKFSKNSFNGNEKDYWKKMIKLFQTIGNLNNKILENMYEFIMFQETTISKFLIYLCNYNFIDLLNEISEDIKLGKMLNKMENIIKHNGLENKGVFLRNSKIINGLYFSEKIDLLKFFYKNNFFKSDDLIDVFISKQKYNQLFNFKYEKISKIKKDKIIFDEILDLIHKSKKYRNSISHNDLLFINKRSISNLNKYIENIEDFYRDGSGNNLKNKLTNIITNELRYIKKNKSLRKIYSIFLK